MLRNYFYNICSWTATAFISILQKQKQCVEIIFVSSQKLQYKNLNRISVMASPGVVKRRCFSVKDKLHKTGFSLKIDLKKNGYYFPSFIIRQAKIKVLFSFSHFVKLLFCIWHFVFLGRKKNGYLISCCGNINKTMMCEAKPRTRLNNLKTCLRFRCIGLNIIIDSIQLTVLLWCINMYVI